ncbi:MAG: carboxymuconolactone decarboxylase family protein [Gemmatimonadales bacterium]
MNRGALSDTTTALVRLAAAIADGDGDRLSAAMRGATDAGVAALAVDELLLQSVLTVGWPRALVAAEAWRAVAGPAQAGTVAPESDHDIQRRGEATCRIIYGPSYDKLRGNVRALHPDFDHWLITDAYGRILSRPGLELKLRELCTIAQTGVLDTPRQLHSHLLGALRAGASVDEIDATLDAIEPVLGAARHAAAAAVWTAVRPAVST